MRFFIVDNRHFMFRDCRLITVLQVLKETAILGRATSWTHFGMTIVGENMFTDVLSLQDMKHLSLFAFNKGFDDLGKIIINNNAAFRSNLPEKKQKLLSNISFALQSAMKQFKEMKVKKQNKLLITIITVKWRGNVEREVEEFFKSSKDAASSQIHIMEVGCEDSLENFVVPGKIQIHSLPTKGLNISVQAVCKINMRSLNIMLNLSNSGLNIIAKVEDLFVEFCFPQREIPQELTITSYAYPMDLCQIRVHGRCLLLTCIDAGTPNAYRWEALSKLIQNNGTVLMAKENNTLFNYVLIPCISPVKWLHYSDSDNLGILMQPISCIELPLPTISPSTTGLISRDFEDVAKNYELADRYGFGPKSNIVHHLEDKWDKIPYATDAPNHLQKKKTLPTKKQTSVNPAKLEKNDSLAHPALGMYSNK